MPVDQELSALATVASLLPTDIIYLVRDPGGVAEADHKAAVSVLDARYPGAIISVFGRTGAVVAASGDYSAGQISGLGTLAVLNSPLAIANGGSGQITQQAALDALSNVVAATNEHVLTKDTASGNVIFKAAAGGGSSLPVADTTSVVMGSADNTKLLRFEVDGFTAGATRVMTPPNQDTTLAGLSVAQTFTADQTIRVPVANPGTNTFKLEAPYSGPSIFGVRHIVNNGGSGSYIVQLVDTVSTSEISLQFVDSGLSQLAIYTFKPSGLSWSTNQLRISRSSGNVSEYALGLNVSTNAAAFGYDVSGDGPAYINIVSVNSYLMEWRVDGVAVGNWSKDGFWFWAGDMAIGGITTIAAQLDIKQPSTTGAQPVLKLNQTDLSEEFIRIETTIGAGNPIDTAALGAYYGKMRVYVEGVGPKWLALYD